MSFDRRQFLKALGVGSLLSVNQRMWGAFAPGTNGPCGCVNILLHGLFFMEFQGDKLIVASPPHAKHGFFYRDSGNQLQSLTGTIDLTGSLSAGGKHAFSKQNLQFSRTDIKLDPATRPYFIDNNQPNKYACLLRLPWPEDIVPLRLDDVVRLNPNSGNVKKSIDRLCGPKIAVVTRLKYFPKSTPPFITRNYYAEHCHKPNRCEVNDALDAARAVFGNEFDLSISKTYSTNLPFDNPAVLPNEIDVDDEKALEELKSCPSDTLPPACPPCPPGQVCIESVEPATCPHFGVVP